MPQKKSWQLQASKKLKPTITAEQKEKVTLFFSPLIETYKEQLKNKIVNKAYNYTTDIYSKWHLQYFYLCELCTSESPNRRVDKFEEKYLRSEFIADDNVNFSYFRHTNQWHLVKESCTLQECLDMINENPNFRPLL